MRPLQGIPEVGAYKKIFLSVDALSEIFLSMEEKTGRGQAELTRMPSTKEVC
jgi:hypothetical protein